MEPADALFNVVEVSVALAGFAGIVTALGQRRVGHWKPEEIERLVNLLLATLTPFASSLLALILIYAEVGSVWRVSSAILVAVVIWNIVFSARRTRRAREEAGMPISASFIGVGLLLGAISFFLQLANLFLLDTFWPYFAGLAVSLSIGGSQFARLLWFGIQDRGAA